MTRQLVSFCLGSCLLAMLPALEARAVELPVRKAGLWEMKIVRTGSPLPEMTMQHCTDETTDKEMSTAFSPMAKEVCSKHDIAEDRDRLRQRFRLQRRRHVDDIAFRDHGRFQFRLHRQDHIAQRARSVRPAARLYDDDRGEVARRLQARSEARRHRDARRLQDQHQGRGKAERPGCRSRRVAVRLTPVSAPWREARPSGCRRA